jgi:hypothetical protein
MEKGKSVEDLMPKENEIKAKKGNLLFLNLEDSDSVDLGDHRETTYTVKRAVNAGVQQNSHVAEETPLRGVSVCELSNHVAWGWLALFNESAWEDILETN